MESGIMREIVKKLVGNIDPVGETNEDNRRFENLKTMTELVDLLLTDIDYVALENAHRDEFSRMRAGEFAKKFFDSIGIGE